MAKLLIVDDEEKIREVLREYAEFDGHTVIEASDGMDAVKIAQKTVFDLIIMDVMMPRLDGFSAVKEIRKTSKVPVIMISARGEEYDKLFGFELGVDDYVTKPFSPKEVMARISAVLKRTSGRVNQGFSVVGEGIEIDNDGRTVYIDGETVELSPKEFEVLSYLSLNKNIAVSRSKLISDVWGYEYDGDDRTVDTHMKMLRIKLGKYRDSIVTVRGVGYKYTDKI